MAPFNVNQVNFNCMHKLTNINLGFDVFNPSWAKWDKFQKKWKESDNLFFSPEPEKVTLDPIVEANNEGEEEREEDATQPAEEDY
ncbi:hypothetical protein PVK06_024075 [Gossypium arboreum]|uniref:Uncharacterized protein n=1 Tax=Gossypium arboreum TaxID=29729 RepID=A0ABR0PCX5_GOSAR|nr:hypothetical protein PVK06_024075 [Gossypium arboreum]